MHIKMSNLLLSTGLIFLISYDHALAAPSKSKQVGKVDSSSAPAPFASPSITNKPCNGTACPNAESGQQQERMKQHQLEQRNDRYRTLLSYGPAELYWALTYKVQQVYQDAKVFGAANNMGSCPIFGQRARYTKELGDLSPSSSFNSALDKSRLLDSIWSSFSDYGSTMSDCSAFNSMASMPPAIVKNRKIIGYLSINTSLRSVL